MGFGKHAGSRQFRHFARAVVLLLVLLMLGWAWLSHTGGLPRGLFLSDTWQARGEREAAEPAIGDLGGVPVRIPAAFAHRVEYEGDPGLLASSQRGASQRSLASRIRAFGFDVRFPDMQGVTPATQAARAQATAETSMWPHVTVTAAESYYGADFLELMARQLQDPRAWKFPLKEQAEAIHGLKAYLSQGGSVGDFRHLTLYVHRDESGRVDTYIECHDGSYPSTPCTLYADLGPDMRATLSIHFRKGLLPSWRAMQTAVSGLVKSFAITAEPPG